MQHRIWHLPRLWFIYLFRYLFIYLVFIVLNAMTGSWTRTFPSWVLHPTKINRQQNHHVRIMKSIACRAIVTIITSHASIAYRQQLPRQWTVGTIGSVWQESTPSKGTTGPAQTNRQSTKTNKKATRWTPTSWIPVKADRPKHGGLTPCGGVLRKVGSYDQKKWNGYPTTKPGFPLATGKTTIPLSATRMLGRKLTKNCFGFGFTV